MKTESHLGVYMDHSNALMLEVKGDTVLQSKVTSEFTHEDREFALNKSEILMNNKKQHEQSHYYKQISEMIRNFDDVLLFGPTEAKNELFNLLKKNHLFNEIKIEVKATDKMDEDQMNDFVLGFFK